MPSSTSSKRSAPRPPSLDELASRLGARSFPRAARDDELGPEAPELQALIQEGRDEEALALVRARPELALARGQSVCLDQASGFVLQQPLAALAARHCCFQTAQAMLLAGFNPRLASASGHSVLIEACLGVGVQSFHRLLKRLPKEEWAARRGAFLDWLWEREPEFGLHAQALSARMASASISTPHCRAVFVRCVQAGSLVQALSAPDAMALFHAAGLPLSQSTLQWLQEHLLVDFATRPGDLDAGYLACAEALAFACSPDERREAVLAARRKEVDGADAFAAMIERVDLLQSHPPGSAPRTPSLRV